MSYSEQTRTTDRRARSTTVAVLALAVAAVVGAVIGYQAVAAPASSAAPSFVTDGVGRAVHRGMTVEDGVVPDGVTVFDDEFPAVANLDPQLLDVLRQAARAAADDGVEFSVTSGWRSPAYQDQLLREAISEYGSEEEAARWVATAATSLHVFGDAVDIGGSDASAWLSERGADFGLCQTYRNEPWHFELRPEAVRHGCPTSHADPTQDPRMRQ